MKALKDKKEGKIDTEATQLVDNKN